jgi:hypothetical protein
VHACETWHLQIALDLRCWLDEAEGRVQTRHEVAVREEQLASRLHCGLAVALRRLVGLVDSCEGPSGSRLQNCLVSPVV